MRGGRRVLALGMSLLSVAIAVATVVFAGLRRDGSDGTADALFVVVPAVFCAVGAVVALRRPENPVGWLCAAIGLLFMVVGLQGSMVEWAAERGMTEVAGWMGVLGNLWVPALGLIGTHLPLRLPAGAALSPRVRRYSHLCTGVILLTLLVISVAPTDPDAQAGVHNPLAVPGLEPLGGLFVLLPLSFVGSIAVLIRRYRRSHGVERQQLRWIAFGGVVFLVCYLPVLLLLFGLVPENGAVAAVLEAVGFAGFTAFPIAIGIAVLRYRLYDIDVAINRTLVYVALTATLVAAYLATVLVLQLALSPLTRRSDLAIAGSTLAVAALFGPVRARIQAAVDRRFYRRRYDAARTLEAFGARLRDQVDIDALGGDLRTVVADTMQPAHVSLWLRSPEAQP